MTRLARKKDALKDFVALNGLQSSVLWRKASYRPEETQTRFLLNLLSRAKDTVYGKRYSFSRIKTVQEFQANVPVIKAENLAEYVNRMKQGEQNLLIAEPAVWFAKTSGTTSVPKYVPYSPLGLYYFQRVLRAWFYYAAGHHPLLTQHGILALTAAAVEGNTECGLPYGSASGMTQALMPSLFRGRLVVPEVINAVTHSSLRYFLFARLALGKRVSFLAAPSPLSLQKIAQAALQSGEEIIRCVHNGWLTDSLKSPSEAKRNGVSEVFFRAVKPDPQRAAFLESVYNDSHAEILRRSWPELKLIGCWLGGSIGQYAESLHQYYGDAPLRDLGYMASEGVFTLPMQDTIGAGPLTVHTNFYEFVSEEPDLNKSSQLLTLRQLEVGRSYRIIVTNLQGLYRYDLEDIVCVRKVSRQGLPMVSFERKARDFLNIAGEKIHLNQVLKAVEVLCHSYGLGVKQFRLAADTNERRYELLLYLSPQVSIQFIREELIECFDRELHRNNIEYASKRESSRLRSPRIHLMSDCWVEQVSGVTAASRQEQGKWNFIAPALTEEDRRFIVCTIERDDFSFSVHPEGEN